MPPDCSIKGCRYPAVPTEKPDGEMVTLRRFWHWDATHRGEDNFRLYPADKVAPENLLPRRLLLDSI